MTDTLHIRLTRPGVLSCGPYRSGEIYVVPAAEARRLIALKGFSEVPAVPPAPVVDLPPTKIDPTPESEPRPDADSSAPVAGLPPVARTKSPRRAPASDVETAPTPSDSPTE